MKTLQDKIIASNNESHAFSLSEIDIMFAIITKYIFKLSKNQVILNLKFIESNSTCHGLCKNPFPVYDWFNQFIDGWRLTISKVTTLRSDLLVQFLSDFKQFGIIIEIGNNLFINVSQ